MCRARIVVDWKFHNETIKPRCRQTENARRHYLSRARAFVTTAAETIVETEFFKKSAPLPFRGAAHSTMAKD